MNDAKGTARDRLVARGLSWNTAYQVFASGLGLAAMLVLVRVIPPGEYGRYAAVLGVLMLLNSLNSGVFAAQALQLPDDEDPDWSLHWSAGLYIQVGQTLLCHGLAALCWMAPSYRPLAPLLHLAALGMLLDWPAQLRITMLRREGDVRRLKLLLATATVLNLTVTLGVGLADGGAYAIVLGSNVIQAVPFGADLLLIRRWRPRPRWWRWPGWTAYRPALTFGLQQAAATLVSRSRGAVEAMVLPRAVGYFSMGLLNRARALFTLTAERPGSVLTEVGYPFLARSAADARRYERHATLFAQGILLVLVPSAVYVAIAGRELSRLLYGERWMAADPLILPAVVAGLALAVSGVGSSLLLGSNRLRLCTMLEALGALLALPALGIAWAGGDIVAYAWVMAAGQALGAAVTLHAASPLMATGWMRSALLPPALSSALAAAALVAAGAAWSHRVPLLASQLLDAAVYGLVLALALRAFFPQAMVTVLTRTPGGSHLNRWLRLRPALAAPGTTVSSVM